MPHFLLIILALAGAIIMHELAHGAVAYFMGDHTARWAGRLTLNPLKHIDKTGSILVPLVLAAGQFLTLGRVAFLYGWAKPVPVNPVNLRIGTYRNARRLMAIVAIAGPVMNFTLALAAGIAMHAAVAMRSLQLLDFLAYFIQINLVLGLFNLIPLPPMDGGRIAVGVLPLPLAIKLARAEKIGIAAVLLILFVLPLTLAQFGIQFDPFRDVMGVMLPAAERAVLVLTGNGIGTN
ncbi:MAG: site-2 protease family protein [Rhodospirillales bacterium]|nr:site-2 protease family protein [Rhodospirillales bacterium]MDE1882865.1 site-2 protease family protein [Rhodospirillales bacterium]